MTRQDQYNVLKTELQLHGFYATKDQCRDLMAAFEQTIMDLLLTYGELDIRDCFSMKVAFTDARPYRDIHTNKVLMSKDHVKLKTHIRKGLQGKLLFAKRNGGSDGET